MEKVTSKDYAVAIRQRFLRVMKEVIAEDLPGAHNVTEFASTIGEYQQNIYKIKNGTRYPSIDALCTLCDKFKVSPSWLFMGSGKKYTTNITTTTDPIMHRLMELEKTVNKHILQQPPKKKKKQITRTHSPFASICRIEQNSKQKSPNPIT